MTLAYIPPASIECDEASIKTRRIVTRPPQRNQNSRLKRPLIYPFKLDLNSEAYVKKELKPKEPIFDSKSMLNVGDGIIGAIISGLSGLPIRKNRATVKKGSGTHKASFLDIEGFVYVKLEKAFRGIEAKRYLTS